MADANVECRYPAEDSGPVPIPVLHTLRTVVITGGAGFIGSNLVRWIIANRPGVRVVNVDVLTYAGNRASLADIEAAHGDRYRFVQADICDEAAIARLFAEEKPDTVIHLAAESHVDRSIDGPGAFVRTNIMGTFVLLQEARKAWQGRNDVRFHHVSTDEVFGSLGVHGRFTETTPYDPSSPYSASKAASDHLVRAWYRTFGLPVTVSNCSNNYGPYQFPEKLIPLMIARALKGEPLPVYGDGGNVRDWLYVEDHCSAIVRIVESAQTGATYNVGGCNEQTNLAIVHQLCDLVQELRPRAGGYRNLITFVADRPGHDRRYAIDAARIARDLGWRPAETFATGLAKTVRWYLEHQGWVEDLVARHAATTRRGSG